MSPLCIRSLPIFLLIVCFCFFFLGCVYLCFHLPCTFDGWVPILDFYFTRFFFFSWWIAPSWIQWLLAAFPNSISMHYTFVLKKPYLVQLKVRGLGHHHLCHGNSRPTHMKAYAFVFTKTHSTNRWCKSSPLANRESKKIYFAFTDGACPPLLQFLKFLLHLHWWSLSTTPPTIFPLCLNFPTTPTILQLCMKSSSSPFKYFPAFSPLFFPSFFFFFFFLPHVLTKQLKN